MNAVKTPSQLTKSLKNISKIEIKLCLQKISSSYYNTDFLFFIIQTSNFSFTYALQYFVLTSTILTKSNVYKEGNIIC